MLTIVPTPIGNLEDMTPRALRALREARNVYCEDTRRTRALMTHFGLSTPLFRYHDHNEKLALAALEKLKSGASIALVSDSGLPAISDPGRRLVALAREANIPVTALPGPSAVTAALAGSGLPADSFVFLGFLPRATSRQRKILAQAASLGRTIALFESPFRVLDLLAVLADVLGPQAQSCVAREISKVHEEWISGPLEEVRRTLSQRPRQLGEFVVMAHPGKRSGIDDELG